MDNIENERGYRPGCFGAAVDVVEIARENRDNFGLPPTKEITFFILASSQTNFWSSALRRRLFLRVPLYIPLIFGSRSSRAWDWCNKIDRHFCGRRAQPFSAYFGNSCGMPERTRRARNEGHTPKLWCGCFALVVVVVVVVFGNRLFGRIFFVYCLY